VNGRWSTRVLPPVGTNPKGVCDSYYSRAQRPYIPSRRSSTVSWGIRVCCCAGCPVHGSKSASQRWHTNIKHHKRARRNQTDRSTSSCPIERSSRTHNSKFRKRQREQLRRSSISAPEFHNSLVSEPPRSSAARRFTSTADSLIDPPSFARLGRVEDPAPHRACPTASLP
jgi:hypothetical protein